MIDDRAFMRSDATRWGFGFAVFLAFVARPLLKNAYRQWWAPSVYSFYIENDQGTRYLAGLSAEYAQRWVCRGT